jgi:hypothetical protein
MDKANNSLNKSYEYTKSMGFLWLIYFWILILCLLIIDYMLWLFIKLKFKWNRINHCKIGALIGL